MGQKGQRRRMLVTAPRTIFRDVFGDRAERWPHSGAFGMFRQTDTGHEAQRTWRLGRRVSRTSNQHHRRYAFPIGRRGHPRRELHALQFRGPQCIDA